MSHITLIAAIGRQGQLGLNGGLPWGKAFPQDRVRFRDKTAGDVIVAGHRTIPELRFLDGVNGRLLVPDDRSVSVDEMIDRILDRRGPIASIWVAGGAKTYERWLPFCTAFDVTRLPYEGSADTFLPPLTWVQP